MAAPQELVEFQEKFNPVLQDFFARLQREVKQVDATIVEMMEHAREFTLRGGKRIRPALLYHTYKCFGDEKLGELLKASVSSELMETALLIHDDFIDRDKVRRGGPTFHAIYSQRRDPADAHFGNSMALLAGTSVGYLGLLALSRTDFPPERINKALQIYTHVILDVHYGQTMDMDFALREHVTEEDVFKIYYYKTACYTTIGPFHLALALAGAEQKYYEAFGQIGKNLGIAFQLKDDILGLFGNEDKTGKSSSQDINEGKKTLLLVKAFELADDSQKAALHVLTSKQSLETADIEQVRMIVRETGSLAYSSDLAERLIRKAKDSLHELRLRSEGTQFISDVADFILAREY